MNLSLLNIISFRWGVILLFFCLNLSLQAQEEQDSAYIDMEPFAGAGESQAALSVEKKAVDIRIPAQKEIEEYLNDSRFDYRRQQEEAPEWWVRLKYWFLDMISEIFRGIGHVTNMGIIGYVIIVVIILLIVFLIVKLAGVNYQALLGKKKVESPDIEIYSEDVNTMDFDTLIRRAEQNSDYRLATRFLYLRNLKLLSDKEIITWNIHKTNFSYLYEIANPNLQSLFRNISLIFDYVWYGEFKVNDNEYAEINRQMDSFAKHVADER